MQRFGCLGSQTCSGSEPRPLDLAPQVSLGAGLCLSCGSGSQCASTRESRAVAKCQPHAQLVLVSSRVSRVMVLCSLIPSPSFDQGAHAHDPARPPRA